MTNKVKEGTINKVKEAAEAAKVSQANHVAQTTLTAAQKKERSVATKIQKILEGGNMALQPFLAYTEYGIAPRVRLVETPKPTNNANEDTNQGEIDRDPITQGAA